MIIDAAAICALLIIFRKNMCFLIDDLVFALIPQIASGLAWQLSKKPFHSPAKVEKQADNEASQCLIPLAGSLDGIIKSGEQTAKGLLAPLGYAFISYSHSFTVLSMYDLAHLLTRLCRSETDLVLDVGANVGQFALEMS